jgi:hypothetical protein
MANEAIWTYANQVTLESSGASAANAVFQLADNATLSSTNHNQYPVADFVLKVAGFGAQIATTGGPTINLYRVDQDIDGSNDAPVPTSSNRSLFVGGFVVPLAVDATATLYLPLSEVPLSPVCNFYIENQTGQSILAGWTLKATPKSLVPAS